MSVDANRGLRAATAAGIAARDAWVESGELIDARTLALNWSVSSRQLSVVAQEHRLLVLTHRRRKYHPREFLLVGPAVVAKVTEALAGVPPWSQFVFWKRGHGVLAGRTVGDVLTDPVEGEAGVPRVLALARAWAAEEVCT